MNFLVKDALIYADIANGLADGGKNNVTYCTNWATGYPVFKDFAVGLDFEYLNKKDKHNNPLLFWDEVLKGNWDCVANFDVHSQDEIVAIRKFFPDKSVWGSGRGEKIEADRIFLKQLIEAVGLPVNPYKIVKGITALKEYIKSNPKKYVKLNIFRGDVESFFAKDLEYNRADFLRTEQSLGPKAEDTMFICEEPIETDVEIGFDGFFNGVNYGEKCFCGIEYHKNLYIAKVMEHDELPTPIYETMEALQPILEKMDYRGAISTEEKIVSDSKHYLLDICSRLPAPLSALYPVKIRNWAEFVYKTGLKQDCKMDIKAKYVGAFAISSMRGNTEYLPINVKKSDRDKVRFQSVCMLDGKYHGVKGNETMAVLIADGETKEEVVDKIKEYSKLVECPGGDTDSVDGIDKILEIFDDCEKSGISI